MSERRGPEIIKRLSDDEKREQLAQEEAMLEADISELDLSRETFYEKEKWVIGRIERINKLRRELNYEPYPDPLLKDLSEVTAQQPEGLAALNRRIFEVARAFDCLTDVQSALGEYHQELVNKRDEILGGQESQNFVDKEGRPDQGL